MKEWITKGWKLVPGEDQYLINLTGFFPLKDGCTLQVGASRLTRIIKGNENKGVPRRPIPSFTQRMELLAEADLCRHLKSEMHTVLTQLALSGLVYGLHSGINEGLVTEEEADAAAALIDYLVNEFVKPTP